MAHKSPKVLQAGLVWAAGAVDAYGIPPLARDEPIGFALAAIENRDPTVREASMALLVAVRKALGGPAAAFLALPSLQACPEAHRKQLATEAAKHEGLPAAALPAVRTQGLQPRTSAAL